MKLGSIVIWAASHSRAADWYELSAPPAPGDQRPGWRAVLYPYELTVTGLLVICSACGARQDWMILCLANEVSIRCRCSHQWLEPDITRANFDSMICEPGTSHRDVSAAITALGYDGTFAGTYLMSGDR